MRFRILLVATIALLAALLWLFARRDRLISDPAALRPSETYDKAMRPPPATQPFDEGLLQLSAFTKTSNSVQVTYPQQIGKEQEALRYSVQQVSSEQRFDFPGGSFSLDSIGVAYGALPAGQELEYSVRFPGRYFHPDLRPFTEADVTAKFRRKWDKEIQFSGKSPGVKFTFSLSGSNDFKILTAQAFDARTHRVLSSGYSLSSIERRGFVLTQDLKMWHPAPFELAVTVAHGPIAYLTNQPVIGQLIRHPEGVLKIAGIAEGKSSSWSSSSDGTTNIMRINFEPDVQDPETIFLLLALPQAMAMPIDVEFLDDTGKVLPGGSSGGAGGSMLVASTRAPLEKISIIRVKIYPVVRRLIFRLPEIPGLPSENKNVQNLFDVRIPYLRLLTEHDFKETIAGILQMEIQNYQTLNIPPGYFPKAFVNVTPRDLLNEYVKFLPQRRQVRIDPVAQTIALEEPYLMKLWKRFRERNLKR
jgi:hypothetical protein